MFNHPLTHPLTEEEKERFKVLCGNSNPDLFSKICRELGLTPIKAIVGNFRDGETKVEIDEESIRGSHIFVLQTTHPANQNIMELCVMIDAVRRAHVKRVTAVLPYYGYGRQDRKPSAHTPVSARMVIDLLIAAGADELIILDLHAGQIEGFADNRHPPTSIYIRPIFLKDIKARFQDLSLFTFVSPDAGGTARALAFAKRLKCPMAHIDKRREEANQSQVVNIVGDVKSRDIIIIDDIADTCGTISNSAKALKEAGAGKVWCYVTHPVLSGNAIENIIESPIEELVVSNSIPLSQKAADCRKIRVLGVEKLLAYVMLNDFRNISVSKMLKSFEDFI